MIIPLKTRELFSDSKGRLEVRDLWKVSSLDDAVPNVGPCILTLFDNIRERLPYVRRAATASPIPAGDFLALMRHIHQLSLHAPAASLDPA